MATKAKLVGQQELLSLSCVVCGVSLRDAMRHDYESALRQNWIEGDTVRPRCEQCIYPVALEAVIAQPMDR